MRRRALGTVVVAVALLGVGAAPAAALEPWWHVAELVSPTYVSFSHERGEVQTITLSTEGKGTAFEVSAGSVTTYFATNEALAKEESVKLLTPAALQGELESAYGVGNVQVSTASNPPAGYMQLLVTGAKADLGVPVAPLAAKTLSNIGSASAEVSANAVPAGEIEVRSTNIGDAAAAGAVDPITVANSALPPGLTATSISGILQGYHRTAGGSEDGPFGTVSCVLATLSCSTEEEVGEGVALVVTIDVNAKQSAVSGSLSVGVAGGGAPPAGDQRQLTVSDEAVPFGVESFSLAAEAEGGAPVTQAASHPFQLTTGITFDSAGAAGSDQPAQPRNINAFLPAGMVGNATAMPQCTLGQFEARRPDNTSYCPPSTAVGVAEVLINNTIGGHYTADVVTPVFNLTPGEGEPARFGFTAVEVPVILNTSVRTGSDYGVTVTVENINQEPAFFSSLVTVWGVPDSPAHDAQRGWECIKLTSNCSQVNELAQTPFLTMPSSCEATFQGSGNANAWTLPQYTEVLASSVSERLDGCNRVPFEPRIEVAPDVQSGSEPSGLTVHLHLPQQVSEQPEELDEGTVRDTTVALPPGVMLNPADAQGLEACSEAQIGYLGVEQGGGRQLFTEKLPEGWEEGSGGFCPKASKIATVSIATPLLAQPVQGAVYLATPAPNGEGGQNPFGALVAMYLVAEDKQAGVAVKLPGKVTICENAGETIEGMVCGAQGQLVSTFAETPQLPFEDFELKFFGGATAPLSTPAHCGSYTTQALFTPWSGGAPVKAASQFEITSGPSLPGGVTESCPGAALPFAPTLTAGTTSNDAGNLTPFTMTMSREDGNQNLQAISLHMPPGLSGLLSKVTLCGEVQANAGTCGPESLIGETIVSVGLGNEPYTVAGGKVYLTEKYAGAPFGLSIVNPANAGPFHLGNVIVRAKIEVNPITAELTVTSDNSGPYKIPQFIDGIPLQIKHVNVTINRPEFTFNPTDCEPLKITGSLSSVEGATDALSVPFQVTNCAVLGFKPEFKVSTSGKTSRADGASLNVKLSYPSGSLGKEANIHYVKVDLPKQLPSELRTLQHACPHETFEANPAACPGESRVGSVKATTPLIPVPLEGPAYFVSYGGQQFPELIMVLQGYGVTVDLHAETFINEKTGVTSSTLHTVPDVPVGTFELNLPEGPFSALGANANLCEAGKTVTVTKRVRKRVHGKTRLVTVKSKKKIAALTMPTEFIAQNGAEIKQSTPISVTGCPSVKGKTKKGGKASRAEPKQAGKKG